MPERASDGRAVLRLEDVHAFYGESHILHGVGLEVRAGEVVTLLGRNGAGKTTTLKAIMGILEQRTGSIRFDGQELIEFEAHLATCARCQSELAELRRVVAGIGMTTEPVAPPPSLKARAISRATAGDFVVETTDTIERVSSRVSRPFAMPWRTTSIPRTSRCMPTLVSRAASERPYPQHVTSGGGQPGADPGRDDPGHHRVSAFGQPSAVFEARTIEHDPGDTQADRGGSAAEQAPAHELLAVRRRLVDGQ